MLRLTRGRLEVGGKGKQAVDLSRVQDWANEEVAGGEEGAERNEDGSII